MPDRPNVGVAMKDSRFREDLCDLYNTVQRVERHMANEGVPIRFNVVSASVGLAMVAQFPQLQATADFAPIANEMVGFTVRTGIPLFITAGEKPQE